MNETGETSKASKFPHLLYTETRPRNGTGFSLDSLSFDKQGKQVSELSEKARQKLDGKQQVAMMAKLINSDQNAPADQAWQPDQVAGFKVGDMVRLPSIDCALEVVGLADPLLVLKSPSGRELRAGWQAVTKIRTRNEIEGAS